MMALAKFQKRAAGRMKGPHFNDVSFQQARYLAFEVIQSCCPEAAGRFDHRFRGLWTYYREDEPPVSPTVRDRQAETATPALTLTEGRSSETFIYQVLDALFHDFLGLHESVGRWDHVRFCQDKLGHFLHRFFPDMDLKSREFLRVKQVCLKLQDEARRVRAAPSYELRRTDGKESVLLDTTSAVFREAVNLAYRAARSKAPILLVGESGTGKEVLARFIHEESDRPKGPFVALNCAAVPDPLFESELFGHVKGAFTGAHQDKPGQALRAHGGTLFLDEIALMSPHTQSKLLRFLQEETFIPVGGLKEKKVDVRILAATNADLNPMMKEQRFRQDLYYRLNVFLLHIPPLRNRLADIEPLAQHFIERYNRQNQTSVTALSRPASKLLSSYSWPGNVRELANVIQRAVILTRTGKVPPENLPPELLTDERIAYREPARININRDALETALVEALNHSPDHGQGRIGISISLSRLVAFFNLVGPGPFPPREFTDFITPPRQSTPRNKLAAQVLKALREHGVIEHNGGRSQAVRYQLASHFLLLEPQTSKQGS